MSKNPPTIKTPENARHDVIPKNKEVNVRQIIQKLEKFKDNGCPFKDKRKQIYKGMTDLEHGDKYQGCWVVDNEGKDVIHGRGVYIYANGSQYIGWFQDGEIMGMGRFVFYNGDIYQGHIENQQFWGYGKYIFGEQHSIRGYFEGEFEDNKITGNGTFKIQSKRPLTKIFGKIEFETGYFD